MTRSRFAFFLCSSSFAAVALATPPEPNPKIRGLAEAIVLAAQTSATGANPEIARWQQRARQLDATPETFERLGWAFVAQARHSLDAGFYLLAEKTADAADARFGPSPSFRLLRGHALHNLHRFHEAETIARDLVAERGSPEDFALLSDALMEQGLIADAAAALQRLADLKPGPEAYSRIAHLRWLRGDLPGAIDAMKRAGRATDVRDTDTSAWVYARLSGFHLHAGDIVRALAMAEASLRHAPDYPAGLFALGRALLAADRVAEAIAPLRHAAQLNPLPEYQWWLADALHTARDSAGAAAVELALARRGAAGDPRTLALFLATHRRDADTALRLAREELAHRRDVFTHDAVAWSLAARGEFVAADTAMQQALAEGTADARLFWHAGEIALALRQTDRAQAHFARALPLAHALTPGERRSLLSRLEPHSPAARPLSLPSE